MEHPRHDQTDVPFDGDIQNMFRWQIYSMRHGMKFYARNTMRVCLLAHEGCDFSVRCVSLSLPLHTSLFSPPTQFELRRSNFDNPIVIWNSPWPVNLIFGDMKSRRARLLRFCIPIQPGSIAVCLPCQQRRLIGRLRTAELNSSTWLQISHGDIKCFASIYDE